MTSTLLLEALRQTWFGIDLEPAVAERLVACAHLQVLPPGRGLLEEGGPSRELGIVRSGRVALKVLVPARGEVTILTVEPGDIVGWSSIVPPYRATSTAVTVDEVELLVFDGQALRALLAEPAVASAVYPRVLAAVARRLAGTRQQLLDLLASNGQETW